MRSFLETYGGIASVLFMLAGLWALMPLVAMFPAIVVGLMGYMSGLSDGRWILPPKAEDPWRRRINFMGACGAIGALVGVGIRHLRGL